jgi:hypothetical protein
MPPGTIAAGKIATVPAGGRVDVTLTGFDTEQPINDCVYMPRGAADPSVGDRCLVTFDDQGAAWVIAWEPA